MKRRQFLSAAATSAAVSSLPINVASPRTVSEPKLKLGLVTYNWGKSWDVPTVIKNCAATGFAGVELRSTHKHGVEIDISTAQRATVKKLFADSPVKLVGLGSACEYHAVDPAVLKQNIQETKDFIRLCKDTGGSGVKVRPNGLPKDRPVKKTIEQIGKSLNEVGRFAADHGVQIRVEVHGRGTSEIPHMQSIMEIADHPSVTVCWNCNPADLNGAGLEKNFRSLQNRISTIHIHDLRNQKYPWTELFPLLNEVPVKKDGFTGWTLLEEGSVPKDIVAAMKENRTAWESLVKN